MSPTPPPSGPKGLVRWRVTLVSQLRGLGYEFDHTVSNRSVLLVAVRDSQRRELRARRERQYRYQVGQLKPFGFVLRRR